MIGYKATDMDGCCRGFKFEVGKTYTKDTKKEDMECCTDKVFHFCRELFAIEKESNYKLSESRLFEVMAGDFVRSGDKYGTNSLTILREITGDEKQELINSGDWNSGHRNSGDWNSGNRNSGNRNSGDWNSGDCNSGDWNSGHRNSGNCNSGNRNSGNWNSGDCNSGDWNSGDWNSGGWNSGNWNSGNCNSGFFNTDEPTVRMFNKDTGLKRGEISFPSFFYFDLTVFVSRDTATDEEKKVHAKDIEVCGGFLKTLEYKEAFRLAWDKASKDEHKKVLELPNWNNEIFKEISGIDAEAEIAKESKEDSMTKGELENKLEQTEKALADYQFNYPSIKELEKENAELKEQNANLIAMLKSEREVRVNDDHKCLDDLWRIASGTPEEIDAMTTPWIAGYKKGIEEMKKVACEFAVLKKTILKLRNCKNCKFGEHNGYLICAKKGIAVCSKWEMKE